MRAVILAGGYGTRLRPLTDATPKALAPIGGEPLLGITLGQLARAGVARVTVAVGHQAEAIIAFCGDGRRWGLTVDCSRESRPLGTLGPLTLVRELPDSFLVMNGDVLCDLDHKALLETHVAGRHDVTVSVCKRSLQLEYGVVGHDGRGAMTSFAEKPTHDVDVNMGIYALKRSVIERLPRGEPCGFDHLFTPAARRELRVAVRPFAGLWLEVGAASQLDEANRRWPELRARLLG
jgi:NDP-sugar pyrophosphorylase family protein